MEDRTEINPKYLDELEEITNNYLSEVRELEYAITHFMKKTNKSTALAVRNLQRSLTETTKEFKRITLSYFGS